MPNELFDDVSALTTIGRLQRNDLLHKDDFASLKARLHTAWARQVADHLAAGRDLDADSASILQRFSMVRQNGGRR